MPPSGKQEEIKALTGIRGIAACLVMIFHFKAYNFFPEPFAAVIRHGYLSVDLFFVLSGFVMALTYAPLFAGGFTKKAYLYFLERRFARVYPLYGVAVLTTLLVFFVFPERNSDGLPLTPANSLANITMTQGWGFGKSYLVPSWSISTEFAAYLLFPFLIVPTLFRGRGSATTTGLLCFSTLITLSLIPESLVNLGKEGTPMNIWNERTFGPLLRCLAEFTLGLIVYRIFAEKRFSALLSSRIFAPGIATLIAVLFFFPGADIFIVLLFPALILGLTNKDTILSKILGSPVCYGLGVISYSVYLCHLMTYWLKPAVMEELTTRAVPHPELIALMLQIFSSLAAGFILYHTIEKPGRSLIRRFATA